MYITVEPLHNSPLGDIGKWLLKRWLLWGDHCREVKIRVNLWTVCWDPQKVAVVESWLLQRAGCKWRFDCIKTLVKNVSRLDVMKIYKKLYPQIARIIVQRLNGMFE